MAGRPVNRPGLAWAGRASVGVDPALALHWSEMLRLLAASHTIFGSRQVYDAVCRELAVIRRYRHEAMDGSPCGAGAMGGVCVMDCRQPRGRHRRDALA